MAYDLKVLKTTLTDQQQDLLALGTNLRFLDSSAAIDTFEMDGFDPDSIAQADVFSRIHTDAEKRRDDFTHKLVDGCLKKLDIVRRHLAMQDKLLWLSTEDRQIDDLRWLQRQDSAHFSALGTHFVKLRERQNDENKPSPQTIAEYFNKYSKSIEHYQDFVLRDDKQRRNAALAVQKKKSGEEKLLSDIWTLRTDYLGTSVKEADDLIGVIQNKLVETATIRVATDRGIINSNSWVREVANGNIRSARGFYMQAMSAHGAMNEMLGQLSGGDPHNPVLQEHAQKTWVPVRLGALPLITP